MPDCLSEADAEHFVRGTLTLAGRRALERHVDGCKRCLRLVVSVAERVRPTIGDAARRADRFQVIRPLGADDTGSVLEVYDRETDSLVALRALPRLSGRALYRFKREFHELAEFEHPNVLRLGELHCTTESCFFTMELVRGEDFVTYARAGRSLTAAPDEGRLRSALAQLVGAVAALHGSGRVQRDLRPANVVVTDAGRVVLLDLGLVPQRAIESTSMGDAARVAPSPYAAPEQLTGAPIGPAADWYAVGALLSHALYGVPPGTEPREPGEREEVDSLADLRELAQRLLRRDPRERPSADEIARLAGAPQRGDSSVAPPRPWVGRERELAELGAALRAVQAGGSARFLVSGEPGIGKTALVERFLAKARAETPGFVVLRGRCYEREVVPFNAFDGVIDAIAHYLTELGEAIAGSLLPPGAALLAYTFPALRRVPALSDSAPSRRVDNPERMRLQTFDAIRDLLASLTAHVPLVLFVEDLQWADTDSLALLDALVAPPPVDSLMVIATVRDGAIERLDTKCETLRGRFVELPVRPLSEAESAELGAQLLGNRDAGRDAAELGREAAGHPLFLQELVRFVSRSDAPSMPAGRGLDAMLQARVGALDEPARRLMEVLAIAGAPLDLEAAAVGAALSSAECARLVRGLSAAQLVRVEGVGAERIVQPFHDRVRDAVLREVSASTPATAERVRRVHLRLGRHLLAERAHHGAGGDVFRIVHHLDAASGLLDGEPGRTRLAELHLEAGRVALAATAYEAALPYFRRAAELLEPAGDWGTASEVRIAVHREWMACEHLAGHRERAIELRDLLLQRARTPLEGAEVHLIWVELANAASAFQEVLDAGFAGLALLGFHPPRHTTRATILAEYARVRWYAGGRRPDALIDLPDATDLRIRLAIELMVAMAPVAYVVDIALNAANSFRIVRLSLRHGVVSASCHGFAGCGVSLVGLFGRYEEAFEFGRLALRLDERFPDRRMTGRVLFLNGAFLTPWVRPFGDAIRQLETAGEIALREGDAAYEGYCAFVRATLRYCEGADIEAIAATAEIARDVGARRRHADVANVGVAIARYASALRDSTAASPDLAGEGSTDADARAELVNERTPVSSLYYFLLNAELAYLFGDLARARAMIADAEQRSDITSGFPFIAELRLLSLLIDAGAHGIQSRWRERIAASHRIAPLLERLARCARACPVNFEAGYLLGRAEAARIAGHTAEALRGYDAALGAALEHRQPKRAAVALELASRLRAASDRRAAIALAEDAAAAYERWGAHAKSRAILHALTRGMPVPVGRTDFDVR